MRAWLTLADAGPLTGAMLEPLLRTFGSEDALVRATARELQAAGVPEDVAARIRAPDEARAGAAMTWLGACADHHLVGWCDPRYPGLLKQIPDAPVALFVRGDPGALSLPQLAIVGSRNASPGGRETAADFAAHLARCGLAITSGLALGIDTAAHTGALDGGGQTIAVLGTGPDQVYPPGNGELATRIAARGALCSEFLPGVPPLRENFPRRNRIISGLAFGTLVVEARLQSGALITARRAVEQGREVFAVPGSIHSPLAKGCHRLIRDGAKLVESTAHVLEELASVLSMELANEAHVARDTIAGESARMSARDPDYARLLDALGWDVVDTDTLVLRSGLTAAEVSSMLLILELEGSVQPLAGGRYQRQAERQSGGQR